MQVSPEMTCDHYNKMNCFSCHSQEGEELGSHWTNCYIQHPSQCKSQIKQLPSYVCASVMKHILDLNHMQMTYILLLFSLTEFDSEFKSPVNTCDQQNLNAIWKLTCKRNMENIALKFLAPTAQDGILEEIWNDIE